MGFFNGLKRALGYSDDSYDDEDGMDEYNPSQRTPYINPFKKEDPVGDLSSLAPKDDAQVAVVNAAPKAVAEVEEKLPDGVFDGIITIINGNLPEFVRDCIDIEKERKAVYVAMGPQFRDYVRNLRRTSLEEARQEWIDERTRLTTKLTQSEGRAEEAVKKATEIKERLMSEERQRRAIVERSHDLEARIADLEAQHEQEQLQNKSLLNKMKVMQVQAGDSQRDVEEIERLNRLVNEQRQKLMGVNDIEARLAELNTENENLKAEIADIREKGGAAAVEAEFNGKMDVANALMNELRSTAATKEREIAELTEKLKVSASEIDSLQDELKAAKEELEIAAEIQEKIEQFEDFKNRKVAEVADLKRQLAEATASNAAGGEQPNAELEEVKESLKTSEQNNVALQAKLAELEGKITELKDTNRAHDVEMANRIDDLKQQLNVAGAKLAEKESELEKSKTGNGENEDELKQLRATNLALDVQVKNLRANVNDRDVAIEKLRQALEDNGIELPLDEETMPAPKVVTNADGANSSAFVSAIDDIDDIDWLMPSPPSEPEPEPEPEVEKTAKPKPAPEIGESQMSLF